MVKALIVDDEIWSIRGLEGIIEWEKYGINICASCTNVDDAIESLAQYRPELIFTDIRMAQKNGLDFINYIKQTDLGYNPLITIVSAYKDFDVASFAIKNGVFDYILKPLEKDEVAAFAERAVLEIQTRKKLEYDLSTIDLSVEKNLENEQIKKMFNDFAVTPDCYFITGYDIHSEILEELEALGIVKRVYLSGFSHSYLFSGKIPKIFSGEFMNIGISRRHDNFCDFKTMIHEATLSSSGGFYFSENDTIAKIQLYIAEHYNEKLVISQMAETFCVSEPYIYEIFKKHTNKTILTFQQEIRMYNAAKLLSSTDKPVSEISLEVGYDDIGYFSRVFKKFFQCPPGSYRK